MATRQPAQIFVQRGSDAGPSFTRGRRQFAPLEPSGGGDEADESVVRRKKRAVAHSSDFVGVRPGQLEIVPSFVGQAIVPTSSFGVLFPNRSYPLDSSNFTQVDTQKWLLDMDIFVGEPYDRVTEMCVYLFDEASIPPDKAVAVYVQSPGSAFQYRGGVTRACPSSVLALMWPTFSQMNLIGSTSRPVTAKIGVAIEDLATLPALNVGRHRELEQVAMNVGRNLFNFMQSFCHVQDTNLLAVPRGVFQQWHKTFEERSQRDPEYVNRLLAA